MKFLELLMESTPQPGMHQILIRGENEIEVDGIPREFEGAALRALLSLALLDQEFKVDEFALHYNGRKPVEARTDFDNAMRALKRVLPNIAEERSGDDASEVVIEANSERQGQA